MRVSGIVLIAVVSLMSAASTAEDRNDVARQAALLKQMIAKFDANSDGNLDEEERTRAGEQLQRQLMGENRLRPQEAALLQAMLAQLQARGGGGPPQFGAGDRGGGFGGPTTGGGFNAPIPPDVLKKFDKNKDGQLDEKEMKAARAALGPKKSRKEQLLDKLDLNGDGKVTQEERDEVAAQRKAEQEELKKAKSKKKTDKDEPKEDDKEIKEEKDDKEEKDAKEDKDEKKDDK